LAKGKKFELLRRFTDFKGFEIHNHASLATYRISGNQNADRASESHVTCSGLLICNGNKGGGALAMIRFSGPITMPCSEKGVSQKWLGPGHAGGYRPTSHLFRPLFGRQLMHRAFSRQRRTVCLTDYLGLGNECLY
jgi:hypothetical protein